MMKRYLKKSLLSGCAIALIMSGVSSARGASAEKTPAAPKATGVAIAAPARIAETTYQRAGKRFDVAFWSMASGDLDGDGGRETILLERERVRIGRLAGVEFTETSRCAWKGQAQGARVDCFDIDGDGDDEILVTAVEEGMPASAVLDYRDGSCTQMLAYVRYSMRVVAVPDAAPSSAGESPPSPVTWKRVLSGQGWSGQQFFSGAVTRLEYDGKKLRRRETLSLPRYTDIYQFAYLPADAGEPSVLRLAGHERLELHERRGRKFKRVWRSVKRYGGTLNLLPAQQRSVLGEVQHQFALFGIPPAIVAQRSPTTAFVAQQDMPVQGMVGRLPFVRGGRMVGLVSDPVLGFLPQMQTVLLSAGIVDFAAVVDPEGGALQLIVLARMNPTYFSQDPQSQLLLFAWPQTGS